MRLHVIVALVVVEVRVAASRSARPWTDLRHHVRVLARQHAAELLEQVDVLVRLDGEAAGHAHPEAQVEADRVLAGVAGGDDVGAEARVLGDAAG